MGFTADVVKNGAQDQKVYVTIAMTSNAWRRNPRFRFMERRAGLDLRAVDADFAPDQFTDQLTGILARSTAAIRGGLFPASA